MSRGPGNATSKAERAAILMLRGHCSYGHAAEFLCVSPSVIRGTWNAASRAEALSTNGLTDAVASYCNQRLFIRR